MHINRNPLSIPTPPGSHLRWWSQIPVASTPSPACLPVNSVHCKPGDTHVTTHFVHSNKDPIFHTISLWASVIEKSSDLTGTWEARRDPCLPDILPGTSDKPKPLSRGAARSPASLLCSIVMMPLLRRQVPLFLPEVVGAKWCNRNQEAHGVSAAALHRTNWCKNLNLLLK